jgi:cytochrome c oxidase subunit IV
MIMDEDVTPNSTPDTGAGAPAGAGPEAGGAYASSPDSGGMAAGMAGGSPPHAPAGADASADAHADTPHPPYMLIWGVLAILMLGKVGVAFIQGPKWVSITLLVMLSLVSALLVALYYMHLRFEPKRLWILAAVPIPLAIILILAVMTEFR